MWRRDRTPSVAVDFAPRRVHRTHPVVLLGLVAAILVVVVVGVTQLLLR
jgi:hypothetical protein